MWVALDGDGVAFAALEDDDNDTAAAWKQMVKPREYRQSVSPCAALPTFFALPPRGTHKTFV